MNPSSFSFRQGQCEFEQLDSSTRPASGPIDMNAVTEALRKAIRPEFLEAS